MEQYLGSMQLQFALFGNFILHNELFPIEVMYPGMQHIHSDLQL